MKNILITGGAGFIGSHLCKKLINSGHKVTGLDNFFTGKKENLKDILNNKQFDLVEHDVVQPLPKEIKSQDWDEIYHLASPAGPHPNAPKSYLNHPVETYLVNSVATHQLLKFSQEKKAKFLFASTSEVYGDPKVHPQKEDYWGHVNPIGPRACYDESKRFGEMAVSVWSKKGADARLIRIFNTYGPNMNPEDGRAMIVFITQALKNQPVTIFGDGRQTRSFCYVDDLVDGIILAMEGLPSGQVVNLGNPEEITINQLVENIFKLTGKTSPIEYKKAVEDDPQKRRPDISKAKKVLNWQPTIDLETGLKKTIAWARSL